MWRFISKTKKVSTKKKSSFKNYQSKKIKPFNNLKTYNININKILFDKTKKGKKLSARNLQTHMESLKRNLARVTLTLHINTQKTFEKLR